MRDADGSVIDIPRLRPRKKGSRTPSDRFFDKVQLTNDGSGCLIWIGARSSGGHGQFFSDGRSYPAHRWMLERAYGPLDRSLVVDHLCRNRACVRPSHLELVTYRENMLRGEALQRAAESAAAITHCPRNHEYTPENTYLYKGKYKKCRACSKLSDAIRKKRRGPGTLAGKRARGTPRKARVS